MAFLPTESGTPTGDFAARRRTAANMRAGGAAVTSLAYLVMLVLAVMVAAAGPRLAVPLLIAASAGTVASVGLLIANLLARAGPRSSAAFRALTISCLAVIVLAILGLLGLGLYHIAAGDMTTALLAFGCVVPVLGVAIPGLPTLFALGAPAQPSNFRQRV